MKTESEIKTNLQTLSRSLLSIFKHDVTTQEVLFRVSEIINERLIKNISGRYEDWDTESLLLLKEKLSEVKSKTLSEEFSERGKSTKREPTTRERSEDAGEQALKAGKADKTGKVSSSSNRKPRGQKRSRKDSKG